MDTKHYLVGSGTPFEAKLVVMHREDGGLVGGIEFKDSRFNCEGLMPWFTSDAKDEEDARGKAAVLWKDLVAFANSTLRLLTLTQPAEPPPS